MAGYYLSEMSVSDLHGGGLTLQRVLQEDLQAFRAFLHVSDFASDTAPIAERFASRQVNLHRIDPRPQLSPPNPAYYIDRVIARLGPNAPIKPVNVRWGKRVADYIVGHLPLEGASWLVVPQYMYSVLVMNSLWRQRRMPYVTWIMDDHVVRWRGGWKYEPGFESEFRFHLRNACKVLVISPAMQRFYQYRFGVKSEVLFGPADPVGGPVLRSPTPDGPVRLAYFGAIRNWQQDALSKLATQLDQANATLDLFGLQEPPVELRRPEVSVRRPIPAHEVPAKMREYDGVVIAASFTEELRNLTELNIATKLSECLASGTVPVIVAPVYSAMAQFIATHGGAVVVSNFRDPLQFEAIRNLKKPEVRQPIVARAMEVANRECVFAVMRRRWTEAWSLVREAATPQESKEPTLAV